MKKIFLKCEDIMEILDVSKTRAYAIIRELNEDLESDGFKTQQGRVRRDYFEKSYGVDLEK